HPGIEWLIWGLIKLLGTISPYFIAKIFLPAFSSAKYDILPKNETKELAQHLKTFRSKKGFINDIDQKIDIEILKKIKCPTLIIHSKNDNSVSIEHAELAHSQIKNSKAIFLDNFWGHMIWIGKYYELFHKDILNFING
ncbi:MAG TPA: alpha/beta hydrolase, partial [Spirochaetota bacterium]|nr:alpha/beta hydrolase [Spirochaetota bacterium]